MFISKYVKCGRVSMPGGGGGEGAGRDIYEFAGGFA